MTVVPSARAAAERPAAYRRRSSARLSAGSPVCAACAGGAAWRPPAACPPSVRRSAPSRAACAARRSPPASRPRRPTWRFCAAPDGGAAHGFRSGRSGSWNFRFGSDSACSSLCFRFLPQKFPFFSRVGVARAASNRRFDASAFWDLISLPCRRRSSRRSTSILSEAGIRRRAKIHNIFIIHENLSYRNKNRLIRSISRFPRPFT